MFLCRRTRRIPMKGEIGASLIETIVALALLSIIGVSFLGGLATSSSARSIADEHVSARVLAESQMEDIRKQDYEPAYNPSPIPPEYAGYSLQIDTASMYNGNLQKITIAVSHHNKNVFTLESYKVDRG